MEVDENFGDAQIQDVDIEDTINENFQDAQIQNVDMEDTVNENFEDAQIQDEDVEDTVNGNLKMHKYKMWIWKTQLFLHCCIVVVKVCRLN